MTPTLTRPKPALPRSRVNVFAYSLIAAVIGVVLILLMMPALRSPSAVDTVTISNPHHWHVEVEVGQPGGSRWIALGQVVRQSTRTFHSVIDPGDQWEFRFAYGGIRRGEVAVSRADLEQAGWIFTVPEDFAERMRAAGESHSA